jgi:hypothetical protein
LRKVLRKYPALLGKQKYFPMKTDFKTVLEKVIPKA